jgi:hypothetical protein
MVMAQTPESTEYDGMPRSAIATGLVDYVLPPAEMPTQLIAFAARSFGGAPVPASSSTHLTEGALRRVLVLLRAQTGHDFSQYKQRTVLRRIERRMAVHQIEGLAEYARYLQEVPVEAAALFGDLLIGVTNFFRDPEAFGALEEQAIAAPLRRQACGRSDPRLDCRLLDRGRGLFDCHPVSRANPDAEAEFQGAVLRHRYRSAGYRRGPDGRLSCQHRRRRVGGAAGALLRPGSV